MNNQQYPIFTTYKRQYLSRVTGYSLGYLCRLATGARPVNRSFIERTCFKLNRREEELFSLNGTNPGQCSQPGHCPTTPLGQWLQDRCEKEHLSLRKAGEKAGLSHSTVHGIIKSGHASAETVTRLAHAFGQGRNKRIALEDELLILAGYRSKRPDGENLSEELAQLIDKVQKFDEPRLKIMARFADFLIETGK